MSRRHILDQLQLPLIHIFLSNTVAKSLGDKARSNPEDALPRMILADALDENNAGKYASFVRYQANNMPISFPGAESHNLTPREYYFIGQLFRNNNYIGNLLDDVLGSYRSHFDLSKKNYIVGLGRYLTNPVFYGGLLEGLYSNYDYDRFGFGKFLTYAVDYDGYRFPRDIFGHGIVYYNNPPENGIITLARKGKTRVITKNDYNLGHNLSSIGVLRSNLYSPDTRLETPLAFVESTLKALVFPEGKNTFSSVSHLYYDVNSRVNHMDNNPDGRTVFHLLDYFPFDNLRKLEANFHVNNMFRNLPYRRRISYSALVNHVFHELFRRLDDRIAKGKRPIEALRLVVKRGRFDPSFSEPIVDFEDYAFWDRLKRFDYSVITDLRTHPSVTPSLSPYESYDEYAGEVNIDDYIDRKDYEDSGVSIPSLNNDETFLPDYKLDLDRFIRLVGHRLTNLRDFRFIVPLLSRNDVNTFFMSGLFPKLSRLELGYVNRRSMKAFVENLRKLDSSGDKSNLEYLSILFYPHASSVSEDFSSSYYDMINDILNTNVGKRIKQITISIPRQMSVKSWLSEIDYSDLNNIADNLFNTANRNNGSLEYVDFSVDESLVVGSIDNHKAVSRMVSKNPKLIY